MKSFCPHCNYEYDVTDDYLAQEATCVECGQDFIVRKAVFCTKCGTTCGAEISKCPSCGKMFIGFSKKHLHARRTANSGAELQLVSARLYRQDNQSAPPACGSHSETLDNLPDWQMWVVLIGATLLIAIGFCIGEAVLLGQGIAKDKISFALLATGIAAVSFQIGCMMMNSVNPSLSPKWDWLEKVASLLAIPMVAIGAPYILYHIISVGSLIIVKALAIVIFLFLLVAMLIAMNVYRARLDENRKGYVG